ncbi:hypothetical protein [Microseira sp. BLCC-F43]|jgi:hypothetical protein|uniref:hypothetical protein n=1 Tax=Microseira sp. BLCC-F43 TaxID=3153602 RepID=UPI0035B9EB3B
MFIKQLNYHVAKSARQVSLGTVLTVPFVVQIVATEGIVQLMGGDMTVNSTVGKDTTFKLDIQASTAALEPLGFELKEASNRDDRDRHLVSCRTSRENQLAQSRTS